MKKTNPVRHSREVKSQMLDSILPALLLLLPLPIAGAAGQPPPPMNMRVVNTDIGALIHKAATYESGVSAEALREIEQLVRLSAARPALRKEVEGGLINLLAPTSTFEARRFACQQLAILGSDVSLPAIADLLKSDETVGMGCLALSTHPSPKADQVLRTALAASYGAARVQIINTLGDRRDPGSVTRLADLARHRDAAVAEAAIVALGKIADPLAIETLITLRKDAQSAIASAAVQASLYAADNLAATRDRQAAAAIYEELLQAPQPSFVRRASLEGLLRLDKDGGEQRILAVLRSTDTALKPAAIAGIRSLKSARASATFAREMEQLPPGEQVLMIESLGNRGDAAARAAVLAHLGAGDAAVRLAAIGTAGRMGGASSVAPLCKALGSASTPAERQAVEESLSGLSGGKAIDKALIKEVKNSDAETGSRFIAVLARRGSTAAVPVLLDETSNVGLAEAAFQALGKLATAGDLPVLVDKLVAVKVPEARPAAEAAVAQTLSKTSDANRRSEVIHGALARTTDIEARCSLLKMLPTCGGPQALDTLKAARADKEARVSDTAFRMLADWPDAAVWDTLAESYRQPDSEAHRVLALRGLVRLANEENAKPSSTLMQRYRQLLENARNDDDRKMILGALAGAGSPDALQLALPLLSNAGLRAEAESAVKKIAESIKGKYPQAAQEALDKLK